MEFKTNNKLFGGKYQHKIVLICSGASLFRNTDMDVVLSKLAKISVSNTLNTSFRQTKIRTYEDLAYAVMVANKLKDLGNSIEIRVESPYLTVYTNDKGSINSLINLNEDRVKYVSSPADGVILSEGTIIMSKCNYDYRITIGRTSQENSAFIAWAEANSNIKIMPRCRRELLKDKSWGGSYFYITGDNVLLMAKMHLGSAIAKVEQIIKKEV